jgi:hypothetical protein
MVRAGLEWFALTLFVGGALWILHWRFGLYGVICTVLAGVAVLAMSWTASHTGAIVDACRRARNWWLGDS